MRKLPLAIILAIAAIAAFMYVINHDIDLSFSLPSFAETSEDEEFELIEDELWIDTIMYAEGHSFGCCGDVTMWGGWYFDTIYVGNDFLLGVDSVGPSTLRLNLVTRNIEVNLADPNCADKIKSFLGPIPGFRRFEKNYEATLDSVEAEEYGTLECQGYFSFQADYADADSENADSLNRFVCRLAATNGTDVEISPLSAFYAGYNPTQYYNPVYTGDTNDMTALSDFIADKTFENWRRGDNLDIHSNETDIAVRAHICNSKFVTFCKYKYDRIGIGHGMYTETFHTFDFATGKELSNKDIFKSQSLDKVKMELFEVMANDKRYTEYRDSVTASDIESMIEGWQSPSEVLKGTEWEEEERDFEFVLPDGAITDLGVVFSFQPYEIDGWAAGTYHFIVPYKNLKPYMTSKAKSLID